MKKDKVVGKPGCAMKRVGICGVQVSVEPNNIKKNTEKCISWAEKAFSRYYPDIIVFPETVSTGFNPGMNVRKLHALVSKNMETGLRQVRHFCRAKKVFMLWTTYEPAENKFRLFNTAFLINRTGEIEAKYRKVHIDDTEHWTLPGDKFETPEVSGIKVAIMTGTDGDYPEMYKFFASQDARVILKPSAISSEQMRNTEMWEVVQRAHAFINNVYVVSVNALGRDGIGRYYFGHSMIVNKSGDVAGSLKSNEGIIYAVIDG
ncbi:MAG: carbon-nitrogen hydrolase family protein [Elusimicrobiota bacterium]